MAAKKTVKIDAMKDRANFLFKHSGDDYRMVARRTLQSFVEGFLHDANAYKGISLPHTRGNEAGLFHWCEPWSERAGIPG